MGCTHLGPGALLYFGLYSRPKSKGGLFLKQRPEVGTQRALCFGVEAFKGLFSLKILLQEREAPSQTFPKREFQVALKEDFVWFLSHPDSARWGLGHSSLGVGGGSSLTGRFLSTRSSLRASGHSQAPSLLPGDAGAHPSQEGKATVRPSSAAFPLLATPSFLNSLFTLDLGYLTPS